VARAGRCSGADGRCAGRPVLLAGQQSRRLGPLRRKAVAEIATDVLGAEPDEELLRKAELVQGNPVLLIEFFRGLQDEHIVTVESGRAKLLEDRLPRRVSDNMRGRLLRMSPTADRLATLASALGRRFSLYDLAEMTRMPVADLLEPTKELVQADIFIESDDRLAFGHDLIREAVRASSPVPVRRALDRQAADVLLARGALMGASWDAARVRGRLRQLGVRRLRRPQPGPAASALAMLVRQRVHL
jgi:predicted ATPase